MNAHLTEIEGHRCLVLGDDGEPIGGDGRALVEEALSEGAEWIVIPVARLDSSFFSLRSGVAGELLQKLVQYRRRVAIVGDVGAHVEASDAFRDFVVECNRRRDVWFVDDTAALRERLRALDPDSARTR